MSSESELPRAYRIANAIPGKRYAFTGTNKHMRGVTIEVIVPKDKYLLVELRKQIVNHKVNTDIYVYYRLGNDNVVTLSSADVFKKHFCLLGTEGVSTPNEERCPSCGNKLHWVTLVLKCVSCGKHVG